jgi:3-hydroxybutyrate dehydrogenase
MVAQAARELDGVDILVKQCRHPARRADRGLSGREVGCGHRDQPLGRVSRHPRRPAAHEGAQLGRIVNIASTHGLVASAHKAAYVAAKHGILGLTKVVALETATTGITCNAICPGWVLTPLVQKQIDDRAAREKSDPKAARKLLGEKQPSLEFATPEEIGAAALFLCSQARPRSAASRCRSTEAGPPNEDHLAEGRRGADTRRRDA